MSDYNPNSPAARGQETRYAWSWEAPDWSRNLTGMYQRIRPGAVTISGVHLCLPRVKGTPGLAVEVVDDIQPAATFTDYPVGTDTGLTAVRFEDQAGGAVNFGDINDAFDDSDYARNNVAFTATAGGQLGGRGNGAGTLSGRRVVRVQIQALVMNRNVSGNAPSIPLIGWVWDGGVDVRYGNWRSVPKMDSYQLLPDLADWLLSPFTGIPWTVTEVNNIISAAIDDQFGFDLYGRAAAQGVRISALWLRVWHTVENRKGFYYARGRPRRGWDRYVLGSTSAASANTYYWIGVDTLSADSTNYLTLGYVYPIQGMPADAPTVSTQEHRTTTSVLLSGPGGTGQDGADKVTGNSQTQFAALYDVAGTIQAGSQAYVEVGYHDHNWYTRNELRGQQITTDSSQPAGGYAGVTLILGWEEGQPFGRPDGAFVVELRSGVGAISGGGTLVATATFRPEQRVDGTLTDTFIPFDGGNVTLANSTQYHLLVRSDQSNPPGWRTVYQDTRSDLIVAGSGTTVANVEGASQGGQTDSFTSGGVAFDQYEYPIALTAPPSGPGGVTVTEYTAVETTFTPTPYSTLPPRVRFTWPATSLGASFGGYRVWVRRRATPAELPVLVGDITKDAGGNPNVTAANVESTHTEFWLYELGWSVDDGYYEDGWDVGVSVRNGVNNLESTITWAAAEVTPDATQSSWLCSNAAPWLNTPLPVITREDSSDPVSDPPIIEEAAGRDHNIVRVTGQVPGRKYELHWGSDVSYPDEHLLAGVRAAAVSGRQVALLRCRGQRNFGVIKEPSTDVEDAQLASTASFWTTGTVNGTQEEVADINVPAGLVFTSDRIDHADSGLLDPGTGAFSIVLFAVFPTTSGATHLSKDNGTTGYEFRNSSASTFSARLRSGTGTATLTDTGAFDGFAHVMVVTSPGSGTGTKRLYRDGVQVTNDTTNHGTISNSDGLNVGGDGGASFSNMNPIHAWGVWLAELTETQVQRLTYYLQGHAGMKMPPEASLFVDLRDARSWGPMNGAAYDLSGNELHGVPFGSPVQRGIPWKISELERKRG